MGALTGRVCKKSRICKQKIPAQIRKESAGANLPRRSSLKVFYQSVSSNFMQLFHSKKIRLAEDIVHKGPQGHLSKFPSISKQFVSLFSSIYLRVIYYSKISSVGWKNCWIHNNIERPEKERQTAEYNKNSFLV